jgi:PAS domain S-box-containing protein
MDRLAQRLQQLEEENSELRYRLFHFGDNFPYGVLFRFEMDTQTGKMSLSYVSKAWQEMLNVSKEDSLADIFAVLSKIHPDDLPTTLEAINESVVQLTDFSTEVRYLYDAATTKWFQISARPHVEAGKVLSDGFIMDITGRKLIEIELHHYRFELEKQVRERTEEVEASLEELTATNEELSSANEEYAAINEELKQKNEQLDREFTARQKIVENLQASEEKMRNFINQAVDGIIIADEEGVVIDWNKSQERITGLTYEQAAGSFYWDLLFLFQPEEAQSDEMYLELRAQYQRYFTGGRQQAPIIREFPLYLKNGVIRYIWLSMFPIGFGEKCLFGSIARDVSEQKLVEMELKQYRTQLEQLVEVKTHELMASQERLLSLSNNLPGGVIYQIMSDHGHDKFTYISASFADLFQLNIDEAYADIKALNRIVHPDDQYKFDYFDPQKEVDVFFRAILKKGEILWIHMRATSTTIGEDQYFWDGFMIDVTNSKKIEEALSQSEEMYRQLTAASPDAIVMCSTGMALQYLSPRAKELFQIAPDKETGAINILDYVHPHETQSAISLFGTLVQNNISYISQILLLHSDKTEFLGEISAATVKDHDGKATNVLMVIRDITERKKSELELIQAKEKAEESDKLKSSFLANMSHEIRTPINGIIGFLNFIGDDNLSPQRRHEYITIINNSSTQLVKLIDDIIDIAKIEAKQMKIQPVPFKLNDFMYELRMFFETYLYSNHKEKIAMTLDDSMFIENCTIFVDPVRLRQVLSNLIGNAIKFTEKGYICFGYKQTAPDKLDFFVEDTGCGLPQDQLEVIFERFRQADLNNNRKYGGTGLGLAISKSFVQMMGGEISVQSELNAGSTFFFNISYIPVGPEEAKIFEEQAVREPVPNPDRVVLLVEADLMKSKYYENLLLKTDVSVLKAADLRQWVDNLNHSHFDLVLVDYSVFKNENVHVSDTSNEWLNQIKSIRKGLPLVLIVSEKDTDYHPLKQNARITEILTEPVSIHSIQRICQPFLSPIR